MAPPKRYLEWPSNVKQRMYNYEVRNKNFKGEWKYYEIKFIVKSPEEFGVSLHSAKKMGTRVTSYINRHLREGGNEFGAVTVGYTFKEVEKPDT
jgi:hypothetical protein